MTASEYLSHMQDVRRKNLKKVVASFAWPPVKSFCEATGMDYGNVTNRMAGRVVIGEKCAREIEAKLGIEFGSLDKGAV